MSVTTIPFEELPNALERISKEFSDLRPFWKIAVPLIHNATMSHFAQAGPGWAPLSPAYVAQRIREGTWRVGVASDQPILQREGDLRRSVSAYGSGASASHFERRGAQSMVYGTTLKKAIYLQGDIDAFIPGMSGKAYSTKLPPRPFLFFDDDLTTAITQRASVWLDGKLGKA